MDLSPRIHTSPTRQKRQLPDEIENTQTPIPSIEHQHMHSYRIVQPTSPQPSDSPKATPVLQLPNGVSRQASPALSTISSLTSIDATPPPYDFDGTTQLGHLPPPAKRRKLTFAEKEVRRAEKAEKERMKAEQKAKRDEEKLVKDEEMRMKNEVKEEKRKQREVEKLQKDEEKRRREQEKDEEKRRKDEEKLKKEKAQPRIMSFFAKPQLLAAFNPINTPTTPSSTDDVILLANTRSSAPPPPTTYYERTFLPFSLPSHASCAPINRFTWDEAASTHVESIFDTIPRDPSISAEHQIKLQNVLCLLPWETTKRGIKHSVKETMLRLAGSTESPIDSAKSVSSDEAMKTLHEIPTKFIIFHEDVRPPYVGTYTKDTTARNGSSVARNPFMKVRVDTDYDYDSEAEWEEPEEGEDLESEGESDTESVDAAEDLEGFLDDEELTDSQLRRKFLAGDMDPVCSGLRWEGANGSSPDDLFKFSTLKLQIIDASHTLPIDPYSACYWAEDESKNSTKATTSDNFASGTRLPLLSRQNQVNGSVLGLVRAEVNPKSNTTKTSKLPPRLLGGEDLEEFKRAIEGSVHNKQGLLAILKKDRFPKIPTAVLKDTLGTYGARVGNTEAEKRWVVVNPP